MEYGEKYLTYKGRMVFGKQTMPYFDRVAKEYQDNEACFIFVNQGKMSVRSQTSYHELDPGQAMLAKCLNYFFETKKDQRDGEGVEAIAVILHADLIEDLFEFDLSSSSHLMNNNIEQVVVDQLLNNFKESINLLIDNPEMADESIIKNKLKEFVLLMTKSQNAPSQLDFVSALFKPVDVEFKSTIIHNLYANLSIDELAKLCHLSPSSFKRKFKDVFQDSPKKYIALKKVEKAAEMLRQTDLRISDIAYDVGFESVVTFNRNFQKIHQLSPSEFRLDKTA